MFIILLCILFSGTLNFDNLTLISLFNWYVNHPFLFIFAIYNIINPSLFFSIKFRK
jgi:hypothetical protein